MPAIHRWSTKAAIRFARDAREWGVSQRRALTIALLPLGIALVTAATVLHPPLFIWLLDEDSLVEVGSAIDEAQEYLDALDGETAAMRAVRADQIRSSSASVRSPAPTGAVCCPTSYCVTGPTMRESR